MNDLNHQAEKHCHDESIPPTPPPAPAPGWHAFCAPGFLVNNLGGELEIQIRLKAPRSFAQPFLDIGEQRFVAFKNRVNELVKASAEYADWRAAADKLETLEKTRKDLLDAIATKEKEVADRLASSDPLDVDSLFADESNKQKLAAIETAIPTARENENKKACVLHVKARELANSETSREAAAIVQEERGLCGLLDVAQDALNSLVALSVRRSRFLISSEARGYGDKAAAVILGRLPDHPLPDREPQPEQPGYQYPGLPVIGHLGMFPTGPKNVSATSKEPLIFQVAGPRP